MANLTTNSLPLAALPVSGNDLLTVSRDGVVVGRITLTNLLAGLTPTENAVAPNATVPYDALVATGTATNIDVAIVPKGTGAFSLQIADNAITGGNKRGANAVDLQTSRTAATQVASGAGSAILGGANNTASGAQATVLGGTGNTASGNQSVAGGTNSSATGANSTAIGNGAQATNTHAIALGQSVTASGLNSVALGTALTVSGQAAFSAGASNTVAGIVAVALGANHTASGNASTALGSFATTNGIQGQVAFGHNSDALGRYQTTLTGLRQVTTGATATRATADGASGATANQLTLRNNSVFKVMGRVVAYDLTTLDAKEWDFATLIKRGANAAATSLVGTPSITSAFADTAAAAWTISIAADTTNGALAVNVQGAGANQIRWYVEVFAYETGV